MIFAGFEFFVVSAVASAGDGVDMRALDTYIEWTERDPAGWPDELLRCVGQFFCQLTTRSAASAGKSPFGVLPSDASRARPRDVNVGPRPTCAKRRATMFGAAGRKGLTGLRRFGYIRKVPQTEKLTPSGGCAEAGSLKTR